MLSYYLCFLAISNQQTGFFKRKKKVSNHTKINSLGDRREFANKDIYELVHENIWYMLWIKSLFVNYGSSPNIEIKTGTYFIDAPYCKPNIISIKITYWADYL